jgi:hypothetical protein
VPMHYTGRPGTSAPEVNHVPSGERWGDRQGSALERVVLVSTGGSASASGGPLSTQAAARGARRAGITEACAEANTTGAANATTRPFAAELGRSAAYALMGLHHPVPRGQASRRRQRSTPRV